MKNLQTLNEVFSSLSMRRRYEVWFQRIGLADGTGAWWFRYLLMNPGRSGCGSDSRGMPVQIWATWFPREGTPKTFIEGFDLANLRLSRRDHTFHFRILQNEVAECSCRGELQVDGHTIFWDLTYRSSFRVTLSNKGWIGFSCTPHSDAMFSGRIKYDQQTFEGDPLGFGIQGHNCGYRHRNFWTWAHAYFARPGSLPSTLEALTYDMPFGLVFRKAVLWHDGKAHHFQSLRELACDHDGLCWKFRCTGADGLRAEAIIEGDAHNIHRLQYQRTDCSGSFDVLNNSLARARLHLAGQDGREEELEATSGAVLEMGGYR